MIVYLNLKSQSKFAHNAIFISLTLANKQENIILAVIQKCYVINCSFKHYMNHDQMLVNLAFHGNLLIWAAYTHTLAMDQNWLLQQ